MDIQSIKIDIIHWLTELKDKKILEKIQALREEHIDFTQAQKAELDQRLDKYERGQMNFSTWEEVKERVRLKAKDGL